MTKNLLHLEKSINIKFKNLSYLKKALVHKSFSKKYNYEKLEFLGDRVLGLVISKKLIELYPDETEGILDKKLASLVNKNSCYEIGKKLKLENYIKTGDSGLKTNLIQKKIISDCTEALIGAIYLDKGFDVVEKFIIKYWKPYLKNSVKTLIDPKTMLQELSLKKYKILPIYKIISNSGPRHNPTFKVAVKINNSKFVEGVGSSKKIAQQFAASNFLKLNKDELAG